MAGSVNVVPSTYRWPPILRLDTVAIIVSGLYPVIGLPTHAPAGHRLVPVLCSCASGAMACSQRRSAANVGFECGKRSAGVAAAKKLRSIISMDDSVRNVLGC